jgi:hypothetical protein
MISLLLAHVGDAGFDDFVVFGRSVHSGMNPSLTLSMSTHLGDVLDSRTISTTNKNVL